MPKVNLNWNDDWNTNYGGQAVFIGNGVGVYKKQNNNIITIIIIIIKTVQDKNMEGRNDSEMWRGVVGEQSGRGFVGDGCVSGRVGVCVRLYTRLKLGI